MTKKTNDWQKVLKAWRKREGLTQAEAAKYFGVNIATYQRWEIGLSKPSTISAQKMSKIFS